MSLERRSECPGRSILCFKAGNFVDVLVTNGHTEEEEALLKRSKLCTLIASCQEWILSCQERVVRLDIEGTNCNLCPWIAAD